MAEILTDTGYCNKYLTEIIILKDGQHALVNIGSAFLQVKALME